MGREVEKGEERKAESSAVEIQRYFRGMYERLLEGRKIYDDEISG